MTDSRKVIEEFDLIPREELIDASADSAPKISPDGTRVAFLRNRGDGVRDLWVGPAENIASARVLTADPRSSIRDFHWAETNRHLMLVRDDCGSEKTRIDSLDLESGHCVRLSPGEATETRVVAFSEVLTEEVLLENNARDPGHFDLYRVDIISGQSRCVLRNTRFTWVYADHFLRPRLAEVQRDDGGVDFLRAVGDEWELLTQVPAEDALLTRPLRIYETRYSFNTDASEIYARDSRGRDTAALVAWCLDSGSTRCIASDKRADVASVMTAPAGRGIVGYTVEYLRTELFGCDEGVRHDLKTLSSMAPDQIQILDMSRDQRRWIVGFSAADEVESYKLFDRDSGELNDLYLKQPALAGVRLAKMYPLVIPSRDEIDLVCYLTLPAGCKASVAGIPQSPQPLVVFIHGGPWQRDSYGFDSWTQFLASRGYAVLSVNFRGSIGFGKSFLNAGDREWGGRMLDDVIDATRWCVDQGIADSNRLAVFGASFGGYSSLMAAAREPDLFACVVDVFGVTDLESFLGTIPAHWKALGSMWKRRVGDWTSDKGREMLRQRSPVNWVSKITKPVLIVQGGRDPRVVQSESDRMVSLLQQQGTPVSYLLFPEEGHGFFQSQNQVAFFAALEHFLSRSIGGKSQGIGEAFDQAELRVPVDTVGVCGEGFREL